MRKIFNIQQIIMHTILIGSQRIQNSRQQKARYLIQLPHSENISNTASARLRQSHKLTSTARNFSMPTELQNKSDRKGNKFHPHKGRKVEQNDHKSENNHKNFQVQMRQSLRRTKIIRDKNKRKLSEMNQNGSWWIQSARKLLYSQNSSTIETFAELEGQKCKINSPKRAKISTPESRYRRAKSAESKHHRKQLKQFQQQQQTQGLNNDEPIVAIGRASKKFSENQQMGEHFIIQMKHKNVNKIALSTTNCYILGLDIVNNSNSVACNENQGNYIRAKKKTKQLMKKISYFQNSQPEKEENLKESKIQLFKNNFAKNSVKNSSFSGKIDEIGRNRKGQIKQNFQSLKVENKKLSEGLRISGWELNGWEAESGL